MARSAQEKAELCREFIASECPRWLLHPQVVRRLRLRSVTITPFVDIRRSRGNAGNDGFVRLDCGLASFRHSSPYTSPRGKADISPVGVFAHEMGHIVDYAMHRSPLLRHIQQAGWWKIAIQDRKHAITSYAKEHPTEDFAEAHRLFVLNPKLLKQLSPERYEHLRLVYKCLFGTNNMRAKYGMTKVEFKSQIDKLFRIELV